MSNPTKILGTRPELGPRPDNLLTAKSLEQINAEFVRQLYRRMGKELDKALIGYDDIKPLMIDHVVGGRNLGLIGVPGLGKTQGGAALGEIIYGAHAKVFQMKPDTMPGDILGGEIINAENQWEFRPGPLVGFVSFDELKKIWRTGISIFVADEVNRAQPRTQSALLAPMMEGKVHVGLVDYYVPDLFNVIFTRNPIESEGTFSMSDAAMDRIGGEAMFGYLTLEEEARVILNPELRKTDAHKLAKPATDVETILLVRKWLEQNVYVSPAAAEYMLRLARAARPQCKEYLDYLGHGDLFLKKEHDLVSGVENERGLLTRMGDMFGWGNRKTAGAFSELDRFRLAKALEWGPSPRAGQAFVALGQAGAASRGRDYVTPADIAALAKYVLPHRIMRTPAAIARRVPIDRIVELIVNSVPVSNDPALYMKPAAKGGIIEVTR